MDTIFTMAQLAVTIGIAYASAFGIYQGVIALAKHLRNRRRNHFRQVYVRGYGRVDEGSQHLVRWLTERGLEVLEHSSCGPAGRTVRVKSHLRHPPTRGFVFMTGPSEVLYGLIDELKYLASSSDETLASNLRAVRVFDNGPGWNDDTSPTFSAVFVSNQEHRSGRHYYSLELRYGPSDLARLNTMLRREMHIRLAYQTVRSN